MKVNWKEIWDANPDRFIVSGWEECLIDKRKGWHLPSQFSYFSAGDMNLRVGIIACQGAYKEEEFLLGGILWGNRLGNGARTVIYFVAQEFSPIFLGTLAKLGNNLSAKAIFWREKLTPSLYPVREKKYAESSFWNELGELRPQWDFWERQINPVALNHLKVIKRYFEELAKRRVRTVFKKNKIVFCWGNIEIAEVKKRGNKFELTTKIKWTRNKSIARKFLKSGWVDCSGMINEEFRRAISGILELLENMESDGRLDAKDLLAIKLINEGNFVPEFFGKHFELPWISKKRNHIFNTGELYFFSLADQINVVIPILEKPLQKIVITLLAFTTLEYSSLSENEFFTCFHDRWDKKLYLLSQPNLIDELRLCQSWLKEVEKYPLILLPVNWKTEGLKGLKSLNFSNLQESFFGIP